MATYSFPRRKSYFLTGLSLTNQIILINLLCYIFGLILLASYGEEFFLSNIALTPSLILQGKSLWTLLTSMFSHVMFFHIFANMFSMFFLGNFLEKIIGKKRFFWVYLISGLVGGIFYVGSAYLFGDLNMPAVGASGALFGLLGVLAVLVPYSKIYLIAGPLLVLIADVLLRQILPTELIGAVSLITNVLIIAMIFAMFSFNSSFRKFAVPVELPMWLLPIIAIVPLVIIGFFIELPIGNSAHFGGLVVGLIYGFYLKRKFPRKTQMLSRRFR